jgi:probable F420-dependent oxidoreductase
MKFGITTFVTDEGISPHALGPAVEERGFDALFVAEHSHVPASRATPYPGGGELPRVYYRSLDPFVALTAVAVSTERLLLGTAVAILVQRDVIHTAKEVASLDLVSGGRVIFGAGVGWNREEMQDHGTDPRTRGALFDEQLAALRAIWTEELAEFHGRFVDFDPMYAWPKPVQQPHPPLYIGGGEAAARRAARLGAGWIPNGVPNPADIPAQLALAGDGVPVTISPVRRDPLVVSAYAEAGVERVNFMLGSKSEDETLRTLDRLAAFADGFR